MTLHVLHVLGKASRLAGGLFETVPGLAHSLLKQPGVKVSAIGTRDAHVEDDVKRWPCPVKFLQTASWAPQKFLYAPEMLSQVLAEDPCLIICHGLWGHHNLVVVQWARRTGRPYIVVPHGMLDIVDLQKSRFKKWVARKLYVERLLEGAACVRAISDSEAKSVRASGVRAPICLIPNGVAVPPETNPPAPEWKRLLPGEAKVLFYIGRINPKKGLPSLLEAWAKMKGRTQFPAAIWHLAIAGWDQDGHELMLKSQVEKFGLSETVHFLGPLFGAAKEAAFRHADAFVLPSRSEGLPTVVLEAWAYKLPVLMTPQCNLPEGFAAKAAIRIEANAVSIAEGLAQLCRMSAGARKDMAVNGHHLVSSKFCWSRIGERMLEVCKWSLGLGHKPSCVIEN